MLAIDAMAQFPFCLKTNHRIYLDHNATSPLSYEVFQELQKWGESWGNPSSVHFEGRGPKSLLSETRRHLSALLGSEPLELIMTSGGSEANNLALKGTFDDLCFSTHKDWNLKSRPRFLVSSVEHPSVSQVMDYLVRRGAQVDLIPLRRSGEVDWETYTDMLDDRVALVSFMYANNETGNVFPIKKLAKMAHEKGALFHCDGVQALGKAVVDVKKWGVDLASFSAHKFYSLKGAGVLYSRKGLRFESLIHGGGQERGRRAGTENTLALASLGKMAQKSPEVALKVRDMKHQHQIFEQNLLNEISGLQIVGAKGKRLPNTTCALIEGIDGETLLMNLDLMGISVSTGAACSSGSIEPSPVLMGMGFTRGEAQTSLRISTGWGTTQKELDLFVEILKDTVHRLRQVKYLHLRPSLNI